MNTRATKLMALLWCMALSCASYAQMSINGNTLYGNEWIDYNQSYYKIPIAEDGTYQLSYQDLQTAGIFLESTIPLGANFQIFHEGEEVPIYVTTTGTFSAGDYIEFYGEKNRGNLDRHLYKSSKREQLNPEYSMYTDTSIYFLTWNTSTNNNRYVTEYNTSTNPPAAEPYFWHEEKMVYGDFYQQGEDKTGNGLGLAPRYGVAEGYATQSFLKDQTVGLSFNNPYIGGPGATIRLRLGTRAGNHDLSIIFNGDTTLERSFDGWTARNYSFSLLTSELSTNDEVRILGKASSEDQYIIASIISTYPRTFDFGDAEDFYFQISSNNSSRYLKISNFNHGGIAPVLYDLTNKRRILTDLNNGVVEVLLSPFAGERELVLVSSAGAKTPAGINKKEFASFDFSANSTNYNYIILSHPKLIEDANNYVQQYADYRASAAGGTYIPLIVDVTDLYDQFSYGIVTHELGIRNFLKLANTHWNSEYLLIIGKGEQHRRIRTGNANPAYDLVPPFGYPDTDLLYVIDNDSDITDPWMAVGRIAAYEPDHVRIYLKKLKEHEAALNGASQSIEDVSWTKRVLHFAGGDAAIEPRILSDMEVLTNTIENGNFGADVINFSKQDNDIEAYRSVPQFIDEGTAMTTFYGHSTLSSLDFDIGRPESYNNAGRYPFFYAIGCNTNRVFQGLITLSEEYVLIEDKGAIGYFGSTWLTGLFSLGNYAKIYYENIAEEMYGATIGQIIVETTKEYASDGNDFNAQQLAQVYALQGDPAIRIYPFDAPDYLVDMNASQINPDLVDINEEEITLNLTLTNIGKNLNGILDIQFDHKHPNGTIVPIQTIQINAPSYDTSFTVVLPIDNSASLKGENEIKISIDPSNNFSETPNGAEDNNASLLPFYIVESDAKAVYPRNFSIVGQQGVTLKSSTSNPFAGSTTFTLEMDTTANFNSPFKMVQTIIQTGGVIEWMPNLTLVNNTTYYWRVSPDTTVTFGRDFDWDMHSFTYIENSGEGWTQNDFYQFKEDELSQLQLVDTTQRLDFSATLKDIRVVNGNFRNTDQNDVAVYEDGAVGFTFFTCPNSMNHGTESIWIIAYDPVTLERKIREPGDPSFNCYSTARYVFIAKLTSQSERDRAIDFLLNYTEPDDYVIVFTTKNNDNLYHADEWALDSTRNNGHNIFNLLEAQGAARIREMEDSETPYIFIYQKDNPAYQTVEVKAEDKERIEGRAVFTGSQIEGTLTSPNIGPAHSWGSLEWAVGDTNSSDKVSVNVYGVDQSDQEVLLYEDVITSTFSLASVDAATYPYLKMEYLTQDEEERTPAQIDFLKVLYDEGADVTLAANLSYHFHKEIIGQGDQIQLKLAIANLSDEIVNNLETTIQITDDNLINLNFSDTIPVLNPQGIDTLTFVLDTEILAIGDYVLKVNTNSDGAILEECIENNAGALIFSVEECIADVFVSVTYDRGVPVVEVSNTIAADNIIESTAEVTYSASTSITLLPGFHAKAGSDFRALIGGCSLSEISALPEEESKKAEVRLIENRQSSPTAPPAIEAQIAPNPASNFTDIRFKLLQGGRAKVAVMDLSGKVIAETFYTDVPAGWNQTIVSTESLQSGMYLVVIQSEQKILVKKLLIEK
ncbi:MAG: C25 family cysteine peptidase [Bacteroidota bacterium]